METTLPDQSILLALLIVAALTALVYGYNFTQEWEDWRQFKDDRGFRGMLMALLLELGMIVIFLGRFSTTFFAQDEGARDVLRFAGSVLGGAILVIGIALGVSHGRPRKQ